jgi:hypothetical protein
MGRLGALDLRAYRVRVDGDMHKFVRWGASSLTHSRCSAVPGRLALLTSCREGVPWLRL